MFEWSVFEEDKELPAPASDGPPPRKQPWRSLLILFLLLGALGGGGLWLRVHEHEETLRRALREIIQAEARAMAVGASDQVESFWDPHAPFGWRYLYRQEFEYPQRLPTLPQLAGVWLDEAGRMATVEVHWPSSGGGAAARQEVVERRAYRLVDGHWRRTMYPHERGELQELHSEHFLIRANPEDLATLTGDSRWRIDLEGLYRHLESSWPRIWRGYPWEENPPIILQVEAYEFEPMVQDPYLQDFSRQRIIYANSPILATGDPTVPLSSEAQYRLALTEAVVFRLLTHEVSHHRRASFTRPGAEESYSALIAQLRLATARHWALEPGERRALRNMWREQLGGTWLSPLAGACPLLHPAPCNERLQEEEVRRWTALTLLIDQLIEAEGPDLPGRLARMAEEQRGRSFDLAPLLLQLTGGSREELEARARAFALTSER